MKYQALVDGKTGDHELLLGNEAAVRSRKRHSQQASVCSNRPGQPDDRDDGTPAQSVHVDGCCRRSGAGYQY